MRGRGRVATESTELKVAVCPEVRWYSELELLAFSAGPVLVTLES